MVLPPLAKQAIFQSLEHNKILFLLLPCLKSPSSSKDMTAGSPEAFGNVSFIELVWSFRDSPLYDETVRVRLQDETILCWPSWSLKKPQGSTHGG
jgi:hypothetical protein